MREGPACGSSAVPPTLQPPPLPAPRRPQMSELMVTVAKQELPPSRKHFDVVVACEDEEGEDIDVPLVSIKYKA